MSRSHLTHCPRCGTRSYEQLSTHGHCVECLYSEDLVVPSEKRDFLTMREAESLMRQASVEEIRVPQKKISRNAS